MWLNLIKKVGPSIVCFEEDVLELLTHFRCSRSEIVTLGMNLSYRLAKQGP